MPKYRNVRTRPLDPEVIAYFKTLVACDTAHDAPRLLAELRRLKETPENPMSESLVLFVLGTEGFNVASSNFLLNTCREHIQLNPPLLNDRTLRRRLELYNWCLAHAEASGILLAL